MCPQFGVVAERTVIFPNCNILCSPAASWRKKCRNKASCWCIAVFVPSLTCTKLATFICYHYNGEVDASSLGDKSLWQCTAVWLCGPHTERSTSLSICIVEHDDPSVCMSWEVYKAKDFAVNDRALFRDIVCSDGQHNAGQWTRPHAEVVTLLFRSICILSAPHSLILPIFPMRFFKPCLLGS